jgi:hypothetical protein
MSVEWLDLTFVEETQKRRLPPRGHVVDHSPWIEDLLKRVGLDFKRGAQMIRIFGYSPREEHLFDQM